MATHNRGLLDLLADYEVTRRRANADRAAVLEITRKPESEAE